MSKYKIVLVLSLSLIACSTDRPELSSDTMILGHGGMGIYSDYPMNSVESVVQCLELGASGTELDVQMSADGVLFSYHDKTLEESTTGEGAIYKQISSHLAQLQYNKTKYTSYSLQTIEELLDKVSGYGDKTYFLDCKNFSPDSTADYARQYATAIAQVHEKYKDKYSLVIELGHLKTISELQKIDSTISIYYYGPSEDAVFMTDSMGLDGFIGAVNRTGSEVVQVLQNRGRKVALFNANSKDRNADAVNLNVDFIQTDRLQDLLKY